MALGPGAWFPPAKGAGKLGKDWGKAFWGPQDFWGFYDWTADFGGKDWGGKDWAGDRGKGAAGASKGGSKGAGKGGKGDDPEPRTICHAHGKVRSMTCLEEMGDGNYICKQGQECHVGMDTGIKRALCKFHQQGACRRGEFCGFAHSEEEIGTPVLVDESSPDGPGPKRWKGGKPFDDGPQEEAMCSVHGKKRSASCLQDAGDGSGNFVCRPGSECKDFSSRAKAIPCRFFANGKCHKASECPFMHEGVEGAEGAAATSGWGAPEGKGKGSSSWPASYGGPIGKGEAMGKMGKDWGKAFWGMPDFWGFYNWAADWRGQDWGKDWACGKGKGASPKGMGKFGGKDKGGGKFDDAEPRAVCATHGKVRSMTCLQDAGDGNLTCIPGSECHVGADSGIKRAFCKFFQQGTCQRKEFCGFAHSEEEIGTPILIDESGAVPGPGQSHSYGPKRWKGGSWGGKGYYDDGPPEEAYCAVHGKKRSASCLMDAGDGSGGFICRPGSECKDFLAAKAGSTPCRFFSLGKCHKGPECPFLHEGAGAAEGGAAADGSIDWAADLEAIGKDPSWPRSVAPAVAQSLGVEIWGPGAEDSSAAGGKPAGGRNRYAPY